MKYLAILGLLGLPSVLTAQTASISGRVTDTSGAVIPGASVEFQNVGTGNARKATCGQDGLFTVPLLQPGQYDVRVTGQGFRSAVRSGIRLEVNQALQLDFTLEVGAVTDSVEVTGETPLVNLNDAMVGKVIESTRVTDLPLNGRNTLSLVFLTPNVRVHSSAPGGFADRGASLSTFSVNGGPSGANNITLDGTTNINTRSGDVNVNPTADAIEEFKVQSGVMSAEHGFTLGGVVSMVSRSGTNAFHGTAYEFLRNDKLDARNFFAPVKAPLRYNQFGGSLGGPIVKNKTFFFYNFEQWRFAQRYTVTSTTPTALERQGNFSQLRDARGAPIVIFDPATTTSNPSGGGFVRTSFPGNIIPASRQDRVSQSILAFYPAPNRTPDNAFTNLNNFTANLGSFKKATQMTTKIDHSFSDANRLSFRYTLWDHRDDQGSTGQFMYPDPSARIRYDEYINRNFNLTDFHSFSPQIINEFRAGVSWMDFGFAPLSLDQGNAARFGLPASVPGRINPIVTIDGYQQFPANITGTIGYIGLQTYQIVDTVTWIRGRHSMKIGGELRRYLSNLNLCQQCSGTFRFTSRLSANPQALAGTGSGLASFVLGAVASSTVDVNAGVSFPTVSRSFFFQDDLKLTRRLTLNLGLRYDYQQPSTERHNGISNFNASAIDPNTKLPGRLEYAGVDFGTKVEDPDFNDFAPRIGFAYDLLGNGKAVVRGGYGMYYAFTATFAPSSYSSLGWRPNITTYAAPGGNVDLPAFYFRDGYPSPVVSPLGSNLGPSAFLSQAVSSVERNGRTPYSQQANLMVQYLVKGFLIETGYSGNRGVKLRGTSYDYNQMDPQYLSLGSALLSQVPNPYAGRVPGAYGGATISRQQSLRPFPYYDAITISLPHFANSTYHSYLLNVERKTKSGLILLASFSFGKLISDGQNGLSFNSEGVNSGTFQAGKFNRRIERAIEGTDSAKRIAVSGIYELPFGKGKRFGGSNRLVNALAGDWRLNFIVVVQDGLPLVITGANNNAANRPNSTGVSAALPADQRNRLRWFDTTRFVNPPPFTFGNTGRTLPDVRGPGIFTLDTSAAKNVRLTERFRLQFRAEAFNLINHTNFTAPGSNFVPGPNGLNASGSFGVISAARDPRIGQLALKLLF